MNMREGFEKWFKEKFEAPDFAFSYFDESAGEYNYTDETEDLYVNITMMFEAWKAAQPKWIKCSEQMPKYGVPVIVSCEFDGVGDWRFKIGARAREDNSAAAEWLIPGASWIPTHWMTLPNPLEA